MWWLDGRSSGSSSSSRSKKQKQSKETCIKEVEEEEKGRKGGRETGINEGENVGADLYETKKRKEKGKTEKASIRRLLAAFT